MKNIAILGSTGSIGRQTLEVVSAFPSSFKVIAIAAKDEVDFILEQIKQFKPRLVSVVSPEVKEELEKRLKDKKVKIESGAEGLKKVATAMEAEMVVVAIPGAVSLLPALEAINLGKNIALATKEILVVAGEIMMAEAKKSGTKIFPVDSEHSAIAQCLNGEDINKVKKIILTASGGPFLKRNLEEFSKISVEEALSHPTWKMGAKITIDSATLMNKGFEVIEAHYLFDLDYSKIEVIIHPQSIIHSMVEFVDGSVIAQLGAPDMRGPIQHALMEGGRRDNLFKKLDFKEVTDLSFVQVEHKRFPCLELAYEAGRRGGTLGAVLNAANEGAVEDFLNGRISFDKIPAKIRSAMTAHKVKTKPSLDDILEADDWVRKNI